MAIDREAVLRQALVAVMAEAEALQVDLDELQARVRGGLLGHSFYRTVPAGYIEQVLEEVTLAFQAVPCDGGRLI